MVIATFLASRLARPVLGVLALVTVLAIGISIVQHFRLEAADAKLEVQRNQLDQMAAANKTNIDAIAALKDQHARAIDVLKSEADAAMARATKAEKAKTYVRSAPASADAPLDPALRDALVSLRKAGTPAGGGNQSGAPIAP